MKLSFTCPRIILMIGDDGVIAVPHRIAGVAPFFVPGDNRHSTQEIIEFIARYPRAKITLFADNLAQDYRCDTFPRLNFIDRAKLVRRRLVQQFPAARLTASLRLKAYKNLMIGLHESNPIFHWAERLRARLPNIALLPIEGVRIVHRLMPEASAGWAMMVSRHKSGGFRQLVTLDGELVFTRLTPLPDTRNGDAEAIARDIKASLDYLVRHGLRHARDLSVLLLMPGDIQKSPAFENLPIKSLKAMAPHRAAQKLGLPFAPRENDNAADLLFAGHLLSARRPILSLMLPETRQDKRTNSIRQWGFGFASLALFVSLALTGWQAKDFVMVVVQSNKISKNLEKSQHELEQVQANAVPVTQPLGRLRQAVERQRIYADSASVPWQGLNELATGLTNNAKLIRIDWRKPNNKAPEVLTIGLRIAQNPDAEADAKRAETVEAFNRASQDVLHAMPDYMLVSAEPPYPALPQESVSAEPQSKSDEPIGTLNLQRKTP